MSMITIPARDRGEFQAYLATPDTPTKMPGIVICQEIFGVNEVMRGIADWYAAKGFVALVPDLFWRQLPGVQLCDQSEEDWQSAFKLYEGFDEAKGVEDAAATIDFLRAHTACNAQVGTVGFCLGGKLAYLLACRHDVNCAVGYYGVGIEKALNEAANISKPLMLHMVGKDQFCPADAQSAIHKALDGHEHVTIHDYAGLDHAFARVNGEHYDPVFAELANLRTLEFFRENLDAAAAAKRFSELWEQHVKYEFQTRNYEDTLETMVEDAYVNHIPTLTGGVGKQQLAKFYRDRFIPQMPPDTEMEPVSRTVGEDRLVDEMIFRFTHTAEMDWMLPGISPTGKRVEVPLVAIVHFRDDKLKHEHIYWDQASVLVQLGLLDDDKLPVMGVKTAKKVLDESVRSNELIERADRWKAER